MRQIDNYTDKQLNELDVKGMTAPCTASEKAYDGAIDDIRNPLPAPNKVQHFQPKTVQLQHNTKQ